jgi:hypothetical protein
MTFSLFEVLSMVVASVAMATWIYSRTNFHSNNANTGLTMDLAALTSLVSDVTKLIADAKPVVTDIKSIVADLKLFFPSPTPAPASTTPTA